jgi:hypothetical protein
LVLVFEVEFVQPSDLVLLDMLDVLDVLEELITRFAETWLTCLIELELELELELVFFKILVLSVRIVLIVLAVFSVRKSFFISKLLIIEVNLIIKINEHKITVTIIALYVKKCKSIPIKPRNLFIYLIIP